MAGFIFCDLTGAKFIGCSAEGVNFFGSILDKAIFDDTDLTGANFHLASVAGADFRKAKGLCARQFESAVITKDTKFPPGLLDEIMKNYDKEKVLNERQEAVEQDDKVNKFLAELPDQG